MKNRPRLATRLLAGGIAGFAATLPMTLAMRALHRRLPEEESYPAPPRELIDRTFGALGEENARDLTLASHFAYGAAAGALTAALLPRPGPVAGAAAGLAVWAGSYLAWIPAVGLLEPATDHPARRNAMMIAAHLVWGAAMAMAGRELLEERRTALAGGPDRDAPSRT